jgi:alpha-tubulin suppressor-like RCC1 family protein
MWKKTFKTRDILQRASSRARQDEFFVVIDGVYTQSREMEEVYTYKADSKRFQGFLCQENIYLSASDDWAPSIRGSSIECSEGGSVWCCTKRVYDWFLEGDLRREERTGAAMEMRESFTKQKKQKGRGTNNFILAIGDNRCGQLGLGKSNTTGEGAPKLLTALVRNKAAEHIQISTAHCAYHSAFFESMSGELYGVGRNSIGQLALGHYKDMDTLKRIESIGEACPVDAHSQIAIAGNTFYTWNNKYQIISAWGDNTYGQLGLGECAKPGHLPGDHPAATTPGIIPSLCGKMVRQVVCGANFAYFFLPGDEIWAVGHNASGQLACGHQRDVHEPVPTELCGLEVVTASAGFNFGWFVTARDEVFSVGDNHFGQLGISFSRTVRSPQRVTGLQHKGMLQVVCGCYFVYALLKIGDVFSVGRNLNGQLGLGHTNHECTPKEVRGLCRLGVVNIQCAAETAFARTVNGSAYMSGFSFGLNPTGSENFLTPARMDLSAHFRQSPLSKFQICTGPCSEFFFILVDKNSEYQFENTKHKKQPGDKKQPAAPPG